MPGSIPFRFLRLAVFLLLGVAGGTAHAQFGQNKAQYQRLHWNVVRTVHFDVHYAQGGEEIARHAVDTLEALYAQVREATGLSLSQRVPFFLYNAHPLFQQTNVTQQALTEGIGGFTEVFKNRVVLPFEGSYPQFDHVLAHEMVHAIVFDNFQARNGSALAGAMQARFPLWFMEGLAEYASLGGWDRGSEFYLVDAVTSGYLPSPKYDIQGFLAYRMGQNFLFFLEQSFGKGTVKRLVREAMDSREIEKAFERTVHASLEDVGEIWIRNLRAAYWPELGLRNHGQEAGRRLTRHGEDGSYWNMQPSLSPDGKRIAWFSDRGSRQGLYVGEVDKLPKEGPRRVFGGGGTPSHESLSPFGSGIAWSPDGKRLAVASQRAGHNALDLIDARSGRVRKSVDPKLDALSNPAWSRDGRYLAFQGLKDGRSDLWLHDLQTGKDERLTNDRSLDDEPAFSPSGRFLVFSSERSDSSGAVPHKEKSLWVLDLQTRAMRLLSRDSLSSQTRPVVGGESDSAARVVFLSDRTGLPQVWEVALSAGPGQEAPLTNLLAGAFGPSLSADGKSLAWALFEGGGWDLYFRRGEAPDTVGRTPTRFMRSLVDTSVRLYRGVERQNLSSWRDDSTLRLDSLAALDSLKRVRRDSVDRVWRNRRSGAAWRGNDGLFGSIPRPVDEERDSSRSLKDDTAAVFPPSLPVRDSQGRPVPEAYRPQWSVDNAQAAVGYSNLSGAAGMAWIGFSDLAGDQSLDVGLNMNGDLENTNAMVRYGYLPYPVDLYLAGYHQMSYTGTMVFAEGDTGLYADRRYGLQGAVAWPHSLFDRFELNLHGGVIERAPKLYDGDGNLVDDPSRPHLGRTLNYTQAEVAWVFDNALWGPTGPLDGSRARFSVQTMPPVLQEDYGYTRLRADVRHYLRFGGLFALAMRGSAGISLDWEGTENPYTFYVGGDENTLNYRYNPRNVGMDLPDLYFAEWDLPLRGYGYLQFKGHKDLLGSLEFRYPFIEQLRFGFPFPEFRYVMGTLFVDAGGAWTSGKWRDQMGGGAGWGLRMNLGGLVLRWSQAWPLWIPAGGPGNVQIDRGWGSIQYWSLGADF